MGAGSARASCPTASPLCILCSDPRRLASRFDKIRRPTDFRCSPGRGAVQSPLHEATFSSTSPAFRQSAAVVVPANDQAGPRDHDGDRGRVRPGRDAAATGRPVVVPGLGLRAGFRLAQFRRHDGHLRRAEGGGQEVRSRSGHFRGRRQRRRQPQDAARDRRGGRTARDHRRRAVDLRLADERQSRLGGRAGRVSTCTTTRFSLRSPGPGAWSSKA